MIFTTRVSCSAVLLLVGSLCWPSPALAQTYEVEPVPAPPIQGSPGFVVTPLPCPDPVNDKACLRMLLDANPQFQAAKSRRNSGILLTAIGTPVGALAMLAALTSYVARDTSCIFGRCQNDYTAETVTALVGGALMVVSVAVGIPLIVSGAREMRVVRNQHLLVPVPMVSVGSGRASFGATWRF